MYVRDALVGQMRAEPARCATSLYALREACKELFIVRLERS